MGCEVCVAFRWGSQGRQGFLLALGLDLDPGNVVVGTGQVGDQVTVAAVLGAVDAVAEVHDLPVRGGPGAAGTQDPLADAGVFLVGQTVVDDVVVRVEHQRDAGGLADGQQVAGL